MKPANSTKFVFPTERHGRIAGLLLRQPQSFREVRSALLQVASMVERGEGTDGVVAAIEPKLETEALTHEVDQARLVMRPEIASHLHLLMNRGSDWTASKGGPLTDPRAFATWFKDRVRTMLKDDRGGARPRGHSLHTVTMVLMRDWLLEAPARSIKNLQEICGLSYPTVSTAIEQLEPAIKRGPYRTVALARCPYELWLRLLIQANEARETVYFSEPSGLGRHPKQLLEMIAKEALPVAVGGIVGARSYSNRLDLVGTPRLDLSLHVGGGQPDTTWLTRLDPALVKAKKGEGHAKVVVHVLRRRDPLFETATPGIAIADPAECLLDLIDARLHDQALQFAVHFGKKIPIDE